MSATDDERDPYGRCPECDHGTIVFDRYEPDTKTWYAHCSDDCGWKQ